MNSTGESVFRAVLAAAAIAVGFFFLPAAEASAGDRSRFNVNCVDECFSANCSTLELEEAFLAKQPFAEQLLRWDCEDECRYQCMWRTVDAFVQSGLQVPQFHGKWPFVRIAGVQEPASAFFSICNLVPHLLMQVNDSFTQFAASVLDVMFVPG